MYYSAFLQVACIGGLNYNGIRHIKISPHHPSSDGLAERAVKTFKEGMKKMGNDESLECRMVRVLFQYRITPHSTTGVSLAELLGEYDHIWIKFSLIFQDMLKQNKRCKRSIMTDIPGPVLSRYMIQCL